MTEKEEWESISQRYEELKKEVYDIAANDPDSAEKRAEVAQISTTLFLDTTRLVGHATDSALASGYVTKFTNILHEITEVMKGANGALPLLN
jgi:hypothetical protein